MPTNLYFNHFGAKNEQRLYEDLIGEVVKSYGIDAYYMPRGSESSIDLLFGDDPTKKFEEAYPVEVYVENVDNFDGQELFSKFGLEVRKDVRFVLPLRAFRRSVPSGLYEFPRDGDLLYLSNFKALFEIKYVEEENFFYTFGKNNFYGFKLVCEKFRYSDERLDTGILNIDQIENDKAFAYNYTMAANGILTFQKNETVYQGANLNVATATAIVASWDKPNRILKLMDTNGTFTTNTLIKGETSGASWTLSSVELQDDANDLLDDNLRLQTEADLILDFSESNPFGEP